MELSLILIIKKEVLLLNKDVIQHIRTIKAKKYEKHMRKLKVILKIGKRRPKV